MGPFLQTSCVEATLLVADSGRLPELMQSSSTAKSLLSNNTTSPQGPQASVHMQMSFSCAAIAAGATLFLGGGGAGMVGSWSTAVRNMGQRPPIVQSLLQASSALIPHAKVRMYHVHRLGRAWEK
jgi:hypothetical protein